MEINNSTKELLAFLLIASAVTLGFAYYLFGLTGIRVVIGIIFISLPFYFVIDSFNIPEGEKFVFSLLLGLTLFSSFVYLLGLIISFRISIIIVFVALIILGFILRKYKPKKSLQN